MNISDFCGGEKFFDYNQTFNSNSPEFSSCFERTVFDLTPCAVLLVFGVPYVIIKRKSYNSHIPVSKLFVCKLIFSFILFILPLIEFGHAMSKRVQHEEVPYVNLIPPLVLALGMAKTAFLIHFDRLKGIRSSSLLTLYWLLYLVLWIFVFRTQVLLLTNGKPLTEEQLWRCAFFFPSYACVIAHVIMSFFVDKPSALPPKDPFLEREQNDLSGEEDVKAKPWPEKSASFLSQIAFEWFSKMIWIGYKRPIVNEDLWDLDGEDKAGRVSRRFLHVWKKEERKCKVKNQHQHRNVDVADEHSVHSERETLIEQPPQEPKRSAPSLFKVMSIVFGPTLIFSTLLTLIANTITFVSPQLLGALISFVSSDAPEWQGYMLAVLLFVVAIIESLVFEAHFFIANRVSLRVRSAIVTMVYRKSLLLSNAARKESTVGEITNLMSVDAQRLMDLVIFLYTIVSSPYQIFLALFFLWKLLGPSALAGLGVMILVMPINALMARTGSKLENKQMKFKDKRIKLMTEILNGIKVLKMYAWEMSFKEKIQLIRGSELKVFRSYAFLNAGFSFTWNCTPTLVSLTTFAVYVLSDRSNVLDARKVFVSLSLFNILQFPLIILPIIISGLIQARVSLKRLQKFFSAEEIDPKAVDRTPSPGSAVSIENGVFAWDKDGEPTLQDINIDVPKGSLVAVVGQVGSGKSSLLSSLLGSMQKRNGTVNVKGSVAYVTQQAWIQNLTVRDNILFGKPLDSCKYDDVVRACELLEDFDMLPAGGLTEIGEKGINLSGGQKQRVSIARSVYHDCDVYLFDDPLSAVDAHVGKKIFDNVLGPNGILKNKTRILVTHGISFLPQVDNIFVLVNGRITEVGTYKELLERNQAFAEFLKNYGKQEESSDEEKEVDEEEEPEEFHFEEDLAGSSVFGSESAFPISFMRQFSRY